MLNQTISVKIKYENIIKRLVDNEKTRDLVLSVIEQVQSTTSTASPITHSALSNYSGSFN